MEGSLGLEAGYEPGPAVRSGRQLRWLAKAADPRRGMAGVNLQKTAAGAFDKPNQTIVSPGPRQVAPGPPPVFEGKAFFASAGEDGDFSQGDDNHYSFEQ